MPINVVLLCTISGIIGLVLMGFTGWHLSLAWRNQTTIECLEKTRYLSPLRKSVRRNHIGMQGQSYGQQLAEIHANAVPGATRDEEGEVMLSANGINPSPAQRALHMNYNELEQARERERYEDYLDERDSENLPSAFDLGWRRNLRHLFGDRPLYWFLPFCNTSGDGWHWEPSQQWIEAREDIKRQREPQRQQTLPRHDSRYPPDVPDGHYSTAPKGLPNTRDRDSSATEYLANYPDNGSNSSKMSLKTLRRRESFEDGNDSVGSDEFDVSSDEETLARNAPQGAWYQGHNPPSSTNEGDHRKKWA